MTGHVHKDLIMKYAELAQDYEKPWKFFEQHNGEYWVEFSSGFFHSDTRYRLKKQTVLIDGVEFPMPAKELKENQEYWTIYENQVILETYSHTGAYSSRLDSGFAWLNEADAQEAYEKLYKPYISYFNYWRKQNENT